MFKNLKNIIYARCGIKYMLVIFFIKAWWLRTCALILEVLISCNQYLHAQFLEPFLLITIKCREIIALMVRHKSIIGEARQGDSLICIKAGYCIVAHVYASVFWSQFRKKNSILEHENIHWVEYIWQRNLKECSSCFVTCSYLEVWWHVYFN
jgi:hypothetical protein